MHLLQQRMKMSAQNTFFAVSQLLMVTDDLSKLGYRFDIC